MTLTTNHAPLIAPAPAPLLAMLFALDKEARAPLTTETRDFYRPGARNSNYTSVAGFMRRKGFDGEGIFEALEALDANSPNPLGIPEIASIVESMTSRYGSVPTINEQFVADAFAEKFAGSVCHTPSEGWKVFDGKAWSTNAGYLSVQERLKQLLTGLRDYFDASGFYGSSEARDLSVAVSRLQSSGRVKGILDLARSDDRLLDKEPWFDVPNLINFANGTLDLTTGELREHDPRDRLTLCLDYAYEADSQCPAFDAFLDQILPGELGEFLLASAGRAFAGLGAGQRFILAIGAGSNGKSTLMETLDHVFGAYSGSIEPSALMKSAFKSTTNADFAALRGKRLMLATELNSGQVLDAAAVKRITGGDVIMARQLYQNLSEMRMNALPIMATNYPPVFDGSDFGIVRRIVVLPFTATIPKENADQNLPSRLKAEASGIARRIIAAAQRYGFDVPPLPAAVQNASNAVAEDGNQVLQFIRDRCTIGPNEVCGADELYSAYRSWAVGAGGVTSMGRPAFKAALLRTCDVRPRRTAKRNEWLGIKLCGVPPF